MSDQTWYVYQNGQQIGPFAIDQIQQMYATKMLATDAYLFRAGWKDWRPLDECYEDIEVPRPESASPPSEKKRKGAPRASVGGRVIVHNNGQLVIGTGVNISMTGIFVETTDHIFTVGEKLKLTVKCDGLTHPFNVVAGVIRYNSDSRMPLGYGLMFESLDPLIREDIKGLVADANSNDEKNDAESPMAQ